MGFNYDYTCPLINENIEELKKEMRIILSNNLLEHYRLLSNTKEEQFIRDSINEIYGKFEFFFERVRASNIQLRQEAEEQIESIESDLENAQEEIQANNKRIRS